LGGTEAEVINGGDDRSELAVSVEEANTGFRESSIAFLCEPTSIQGANKEG
jgi:hypothetical protein